MKVLKFCTKVIFDYALVNVIKAVGIVMTMSILLQIFSRVAFKVPFPWTDELARGTFIWFCFLGSALAMRQYAHLGLDYFRSKFPRRGQWVCDIIVALSVIFFGAMIAYWGFKLMGMQGRQRTPIMRISMQWFYLAVPLSGALLALQGLEFLLDYIVTGQPRANAVEPETVAMQEMEKMF